MSRQRGRLEHHVSQGVRLELMFTIVTDLTREHHRDG